MRLSIDLQALREESDRKNRARDAVEIRIASLVEEGLPANAIALRVGISTSTIRRLLRKLRAATEG